MIKYARITGGEEMVAVLRELPDALARNALSAGARAGAQTLQDQAFVELMSVIKTSGPRPIDDVIIKKLRPPKGAGVQAMYGVGPPTRKPWLRWLHDGTKAHLIAIKRASFLGRDGTYFGIVVRHPGTPPQPWLKQAQFVAEPAVYAAAASKLGPALRKQVRRLVSQKYTAQQLKRIFR